MLSPGAAISGGRPGRDSQTRDDHDQGQEHRKPTFAFSHLSYLHFFIEALNAPRGCSEVRTFPGAGRLCAAHGRRAI